MERIGGDKRWIGAGSDGRRKVNDPDNLVAECVLERLERLQVIWMMWSSVALAAVTQKARSGRLNGRWEEAEVNRRKVGGERERRRRRDDERRL